jgi:hypothetical protein
MGFISIAKPSWLKRKLRGCAQRSEGQRYLGDAA